MHRPILFTNQLYWINCKLKYNSHNFIIVAQAIIPLPMLKQSRPQDITKVEHIANGKCVCEACNCGRHKCPSPKRKGQYHTSYAGDYPQHQNYKPQPKYNMIHKNFILPEDKFNGQSSYTDQYNEKNKGLVPVEKFKPKGELQLSKDPFKANTSYIEDYLNRGQGGRPQKVKPTDNKFMPEGKFEGGSENHDNFLGGQGERLKQFRPEGQLKIGGPFQGKSSYLADYENQGSPVRAEKVTHPQNQIMPQGAFQGDTSYHNNFLGSKAERSPQIRPQGQLKIGGPFEGSSSYGADYMNKGNPIRAERVPQPRNQIMPEGKFQGESIYHDNYIPGKIEKQQQFRPQGELKVGGNFEGTSSYLNDYLNRGNGIKAERVPLPKNQIMPEGRFEGDSDYKSHYVQGKSERPQQIRPEGQLKIGGNWQGATSYGADYMNKGPGIKNERVPLPRNQIMPEGKFQGNSAYAANYPGSKAQRNPQIRPNGELKVGEGKFDGNSSYANDYLNKGKPIRAQRVPLPKNQIMPEGRFQGDSNYHENFIPSHIQKGQPFKPVQQLQVGGQFSGGSSYKDAYNPKKIQMENCPCDKLDAPRYQINSREHIRYDEKAHKWE